MVASLWAMPCPLLPRDFGVRDSQGWLVDDRFGLGYSRDSQHTYHQIITAIQLIKLCHTTRYYNSPTPRQEMFSHGEIMVNPSQNHRQHDRSVLGREDGFQEGALGRWSQRVSTQKEGGSK